MIRVVKATYLLKHNIDMLLKARGQTRHDLAFWCRRTDPWLSKLFSDESRNIPLKYLDRIADFFGLATYQLFQPGISPLTERRTGRERRAGTDRRISARNHTLPVTPIRQIEISPDDEALLAELQTLTYEEHQRLRHWVSVVRLGRPGARETGPPPDRPVTTAAPAAAAPRRRRAGKQ